MRVLSRSWVVGRVDAVRRLVHEGVRTRHALGVGQETGIEVFGAFAVVGVDGSVSRLGS